MCRPSPRSFRATRRRTGSPSLPRRACRRACAVAWCRRWHRCVTCPSYARDWMLAPRCHGWTAPSPWPNAWPTRSRDGGSSWRNLASGPSNGDHRPLVLEGPLIDTEPVGEPVHHDFLAERRVVVLTVLGTRLLLRHEAQGDVEAGLLGIVVDHRRRIDAEDIVSAMADQER